MLSTSAFAEETSAEAVKPTEERSTLDKATDMATEAAKSVNDTLNATQEKRKTIGKYILANYSALDLIIPGKYGFTFGAMRDPDKAWEFEYLKGSLAVPFLIQDLGSMTDERFSLMARSHRGNSFNLSYGFSYFKYALTLGDKYLNRLVGSYPSLDLMEIHAIGFNFAVGNRWIFGNGITLGLDWFSWAQPVYVTKKSTTYLDYVSNTEDKDDAEKAVKFISYFPRLAVFKFQFGWSF